MRQEKTLKPCANFTVTEKPSCELQPMGNKQTQFMWACHDFSDPELGSEGGLEKLAIRFQKVE